ncbi:MAG: family N-acetyltransferase [Akkermansiaceae bacterium]|nr:family N-acetyltransferase [Akkermansiaceae bacterium]
MSIVTAYWAGFFDCISSELFAEPARFNGHVGEMEGYWGAWALFREGSAMISLPPDSEALISSLLTTRTIEEFAAALKPVTERTIGPAYVGYAASLSGGSDLARSLTPADAAALDQLQGACDETDWDHGGGSIDQPCSGVFIDGRLAALAGYEIWGGTIAHLSVVTHPAFRGKGHGRDAVAHLAERAIEAGLLPQYRTLESNLASIQIARALGFEHYASSMAVRFTTPSRRTPVAGG